MTLIDAGLDFSIVFYAASGCPRVALKTAVQDRLALFMGTSNTFG